MFNQSNFSIMELGNLKLGLGKEVECSFEFAKQMVGNDHNFRNITGYYVEETDFESVRNLSYSVKKTKKKGSIVYEPNGQEWKCEEGQFVIIVRWDYYHPSNFSNNKLGNEGEFNFAK